MDEVRAARVWARLRDLARGEGTALSVRHACLACAEAVDATGVGLALRRDDGICEPVYATDQRAQELEELQFTLGEGPGVDALRMNRPVLVDDLSTPGHAPRWPLFAAEAAQRGVCAVLALPVQAGAVRLGVLDCYRDRPGLPEPDALAEALIYADAVLMLALDQRGGVSVALAELLDTGFAIHRARVHQAAGMVSVQLAVTVAEALTRLRAHAFASHQPLAQVAADVLARRLRFTPGLDAEPSVTLTTDTTGSGYPDVEAPPRSDGAPRDVDEEKEGTD